MTLSQQGDMQVSLHVFSDVSSRAYAVVAYLHVADAEGRVVVNLVVLKCCLGPPDEETIPHLELLGTLIGSQLLKFLREEYDGILKIEEEFLWTDSSVVLAWINQGPCVSGVFVANRVKEINLYWWSVVLGANR